MGRFLPVCPKCESTNTDLYRDRTASARSFPHDAIFHCRCCGYRLLGLSAVEYTNRLMAEFQEAEKNKADARLREIEAERTRKLEAETRRLVEEARKLEERERKKVLPFPTPARAICAWHECQEPCRANSMYCSRNCSNKNARARHRARQEGQSAG